MMGIVQQVDGAGGVLLRKGEILVITENSTDKSYGKVEGMISIPMGLRLPEERWDEAAKREFFEETGYHVELICPWPWYFLIPAANIEIYWMKLVNDNETPTRTREGLCPKWMGLGDFLNHEFVRYPSKEATFQIVEIIKDVAAGSDNARRKKFLSDFLVPEFV